MPSNKFKGSFKPPSPKPNKLLGQHFLRDQNVLTKIIAAADLTKNDSVLEVGPGLGVLTRELAKCAGQVLAVEKDKTLAGILIDQLANEKINNVKIIEDDILEFLKTKSDQLPADYKVVANIPYYLTSHLIRLLLESTNPPRDIVLLIQKEVAKRICAKPPEMSLLAVSVQFYATAKIVASVSRKSFRPEPKVDSAVIKMTPHQKYRDAEMSKYFALVHAGFSHPRKQLLGNLSKELSIEKEKINLALAKAGIKNSQRAETLTIEDWRKLSAALDL